MKVFSFSTTQSVCYGASSFQKIANGLSLSKTPSALSGKHPVADKHFFNTQMLHINHLLCSEIL